MPINKTNKIKLGIASAFTIFLIAFMIQNRQVIEVHVLFATMEIRRSIMILFTFAIGTSLGWVLRSFRP